MIFALIVWFIVNNCVIVSRVNKTNNCISLKVPFRFTERRVLVRFLLERRFSFDSHASRSDFKTTAMTNLNGIMTPPSTPSPNLMQINLAREREKYLEEYNFPFCEAATKYEKLAKIGQGTFG